MAAIEGNHHGPVLTHNPPGPPWVMDAGWWDVGVRQGGICKMCVWMASGFTALLPPIPVADYSVCQSLQLP